MVKRMYPRANNPNLLALEDISTECTTVSGAVPSISNVQCLCKTDKELPPPTSSFRGKFLPGVQSSISCLRPESGNAQTPHTVRFPVLPPISQIGILSSRTDSSSGFDERKRIGSRIAVSNVTCLNADVLAKDMAYSTALPSGRMAKKDYGIKSFDSEFIKLCKMNGRKNLLKDMEILNKKTSAVSNVYDFEMTNRRTMLRSPNESWKPSEWTKFEVHKKYQLR